MTTNSRDTAPPRQVRPVRPTRRSVSGVYAFRGETAIEFESTLERDFLIRTEFFLDVLDVIPQPVQVPFRGVNGQEYHYTPDFLVYYRLGDRRYADYPRPMLVEVKPEQEWRRHWRAWSAKWKAAGRYAREQGWTFRIHDESRIRDGVLDNIRFLERYRRLTFPPEQTWAVLGDLRAMGSAPFHYLLARHFSGLYRGTGIAHLWHLLATRQVDGDLSRPLSEFTEVWVPTDE